MPSEERERTRSVLGVFAVARDLRVMLRVPVVQVEVATYLEEERDLAGTQLVALALDHLRGPTETFRHLWTTSFLRGAILTWIVGSVTDVVLRSCRVERDTVSKSIGILTAGGDSPGLNAAIRAIGK